MYMQQTLKSEEILPLTPNSKKLRVEAHTAASACVCVFCNNCIILRNSIYSVLVLIIHLYTFLLMKSIIIKFCY